MSGDTGRALAAPGQYLTFRIGSELYGVSVLETSEVLELRGLTPVPGSPSWVAGMLNLRGRAIPVLDLAMKFGATGSSPGDPCVVVLEIASDGEQSQIGVVADDMPAVIELAGEQIAEPPLFGTLVDVRFLRGMARTDSGLVLLLDAAGALTSDEAAIVSALESRANQHASEMADHRPSQGSQAGG